MTSTSRFRLPRLISDGMVIQRNANVKIWGWAPVGEVVTVRFLGQAYETTSDIEGKWQVRFATGDAGGPYEMEIETRDGTDHVTLHNILLGDVWLCSGQSNMEMRMGSVREVYPEEIAGADYEAIRQFAVPATYDFKRAHDDVESGNWVAATPETVLSFSAVAYFCAKQLYETYGVPIGLLNASLGGAPAEAFMSDEALRSFPEVLEAVQPLKDQAYVDALIRQDETALRAWVERIDREDAGLADAGKPWHDPDFDASSWPLIRVPSYWAEEGVGAFNGVVWFRREFEVPSSLNGKLVRLKLGNVVDENTVYINGTMVGSTPMQWVPSEYELQDGVLREGKNTIVVRVVNFSGSGGFYPGKPYHLDFGDQILDLSGEWTYAIGAKSEPLPDPSFLQWRPTGLYNGMIAPLIPYAIKGALWYQGEGNAGRHWTYERLLRELIIDWRHKWGQGDFPFLIVQLPNFLRPSDRPVSGNWPHIREAQRRALALPGTGIAVTIGLGEWNDVHPVNKRDVGDRLALVARKVAYGDDEVVAGGPLFQSAERDGNRILLTFRDIGSGLVARGGDALRHFAIAGGDGEYVWAEAVIEGHRVAVWSDQVADPVHVRYAWADNPEQANLYNREGLPASPFATEYQMEGD